MVALRGIFAQRSALGPSLEAIYNCVDSVHFGILKCTYRIFFSEQKLKYRKRNIFVGDLTFQHCVVFP